jgi:hypothetical protein
VNVQHSALINAGITRLSLTSGVDCEDRAPSDEHHFFAGCHAHFARAIV